MAIIKKLLKLSLFTLAAALVMVLILSIASIIQMEVGWGNEEELFWGLWVVGYFGIPVSFAALCMTTFLYGLKRKDRIRTHFEKAVMTVIVWGLLNVGIAVICFLLLYVHAIIFLIYLFEFLMGQYYLMYGMIAKLIYHGISILVIGLIKLKKGRKTPCEETSSPSFN